VKRQFDGGRCGARLFFSAGRAARLMPAAPARKNLAKTANPAVTIFYTMV
jgi:hypothetical protein